MRLPIPYAANDPRRIAPTAGRGAKEAGGDEELSRPRLPICPPLARAAEFAQIAQPRKLTRAKRGLLAKRQFAPSSMREGAGWVGRLFSPASSVMEFLRQARWRQR